MQVLHRTLAAGVDVVRLNFSHGDSQDHIDRATKVRELAHSMHREIGVLIDLQGPKLRISRFREGKIELTAGATFILDANLDKDAGDVSQVGIEYKTLARDLKANDTLLLDDGRIVLQVQKIKGDTIITTVIEGGHLSDSKGINKKGGGLSAPALTEKDKQDIQMVATLQPDYVAISFARSAADIHLARELIRKAGSFAAVVAKIERIEALEDLDNIIMAADSVMVARGDLGVELGDAALPGAQKHIIARARTLNKTVIVATQMMESMIENSTPTRAEVFDVANAVLDGTDAVMLSAETASGKNPDKVVDAMSRICLGAEQEKMTLVSRHRVDSQFDRVDEAIAMATMYTANHINVKAIIVLTESGSMPLWMSRIRSGIPIYALSRHQSTRRRMTLFRGVYPIDFDPTKVERVELNKRAVEHVKRLGIVMDGDLVIIARGDNTGVNGGGNTMKIVAVGSVI
jgi:pyruvate kinase